MEGSGVMQIRDFLKRGPKGTQGESSTSGSTNKAGGGAAGPGGNGNKAEMGNRIAMILLPVLAVFFLVSVVMNSFYILSETESAVITTLGKASVNNNKGLQFKIPFLQDVTKISTTVRSFEVGYVEGSDGTYRNVESESTMITSDMNFVDIDFYVTYQVTDPIQYMYAAEEPELLLKNLVQSTIRGTVSAYTVDSALTTGKSDIQQNIKNIVMQELEEENIGLSLIDISIQDVEPPTEQIKEAFSEVENARQNKESALNEANQYRNEQIPAAEAKADKIIQKAEANKTARINEANGQVARGICQISAHHAAAYVLRGDGGYSSQSEDRDQQRRRRIDAAHVSGRSGRQFRLRRDEGTGDGAGRR